MSRTVAERRFQSRSMTSASSGPRNFSSAFSGRRSRRRSGRRTARLSRAPAPDGDAPAAAEEPEPPRIGKSLEGLRGALILFVAPALEQGRIAREEVELEVFDGHPLTAR